MSGGNRNGRNRALVTGAGGFIGRHLVESLARSGDFVRAIDRSGDGLRELERLGNVEIVVGDICDHDLQREAVANVGVVYHLAAAHLGASTSDSEFWSTNVDALGHLLEFAASAGVSRFVHCSSVGVYGHIESPPADESTPCRPELVYEKTKMAGEEVVLKAVRDHGFPAVVIRPVWVYGPGCPRTEKLFRSIKKGRFAVAGKGDQLRHCIYIDDMIEAFHLASHANKALGEVMVVGDAKPVTIRHLVDEIARLTHSRRPISIPMSLMSCAAIAAEKLFLPLRREPPISRRTLKFFNGNTAFRTDRARTLLGFEPKYDLSSGLAETWRRMTSETSRSPRQAP